jgi:hypothetical protein
MIYIFPADKQGCGLYRLIWPAHILSDMGIDVTIIDPASRDSGLQGIMDGDRMTDVKIPADAELMIFQRVSHYRIVEAIKIIRAKGIPVIIDMDDDLGKIHPANPAFNLLRPKGQYPDHSWENAQEACDNATMVVTATPALLKIYARHGRGRVFDNYVPYRMLDIEHVDNDVVGWAGSVHSHPDDLGAMGPAVSRLMREGFTFANIGSGEGIQKAWGLPEDAPIHVSGVVPIAQWGEAVTKLGIGVAPLANTKFNEAKSWLKMAEYAAVGVPCVGSDMPEYRRLHKLGVGMLARTPADWYRIVKDLGRSAAMRHDLAQQGREVMLGMTMEANAWRLAEIWDEAKRLSAR